MLKAASSSSERSGSLPSTPQLQRSANNIGPAARRHDFVAGGQICRAHHGRVFAATAASIALLEIADEGMIFEGEGQPRRKRQLDRP